MKKMLAVLFCLCLGYLCHAQEVLAYTLNAAATAAAPWEVGGVVAHGVVYEVSDIDQSKDLSRPDFVAQGVYRKFLGVTDQGLYVAQEFFDEGDVKFTDPYQLVDAAYVTEADFSANMTSKGGVSGRYVEWYLNAEKRYEAQYDSGVLQGEEKNWYSNGQLEGRRMFVDGTLAGESVHWYPNGNVMSRFEYEKGRLTGPATQWYENGVKQEERMYANDCESGMHTGWHRNGQKAFERWQVRCVSGQVRDPVPYGLWRWWDEQGNLIKEEDHGPMPPHLVQHP